MITTSTENGVKYAPSQEFLPKNELLFRMDETDVLTEDVIENFIVQHKSLLTRYTKLKNYHIGRHDIFKRTQDDPTLPNKRVVTNYCSLAVKTTTGYVSGKPVTVKISDNKMSEIFTDIAKRNDEADKNAEMFKNLAIYGDGYEVVYVVDRNKNKFVDGQPLPADPQLRYAKIANEEMFIVYDYELEPQPLYAIRYYMIGTEMRVEVYSKLSTKVYKKSNAGYQLISDTPHYFLDVPVVPFINNSEKMGDFEPFLELQDEWNDRLSDLANTLSYCSDAFLVIENMSETQKSDIDSAKKMRVFLVENGGKITWLQKPVDASSTDSELGKLKEGIFMIGSFPDWSSEAFAGNLSGVAISFKLLNLEQIASIKERKFRASLMRRYQLFCNYLKTQGYEFDTNNIELQFTRNVPQNLTEIATVIAQLRGIVSDETLISLLPFIEDIKKELDAVKEQNSGELNSDDMQKMLNKYMTKANTNTEE